MWLVVASCVAGVVRGQQGQQPPQAQALFRRLDRNGDGVLTSDEVERPGLFRRMDTDGNGRVTSQEARASLRLEEGARRPQPAVPPTHADVPYGPHERNVLDLYLAKSDEPTPLLVFIHGGGFVGGDKRNVQPPLIRDMHRHGVSVASLNYRFVTTDPMPACFHDAARAVQFLRLNAPKYNLDPKRFAASGGSAGAGISLWLAFHDDLVDPVAEDPLLRQSTRLSCAAVSGAQVSYDPRFWRQIGLARGLDHPSFGRMYGRREGEPPESPRLVALYEECASITHATADDPPVYMTYGVADEIGPDTPMNAIIHHPRHGLVLREKLEPLGVECIVVYRGGPEPPMSQSEFLVRHLKAGAPPERSMPEVHQPHSATSTRPPRMASVAGSRTASPFSL